MPGELRLPAAARAWGTPEFAAVLKAELEALPQDSLPLAAALTRGSHVADEPHRVRVIAAHERDGLVHARVGVFYAGIIAGCSCADDPTPVEPQPEYCEFTVTLDPHTGAATLTLGDGVA